MYFVVFEGDVVSYYISGISPPWENAAPHKPKHNHHHTDMMSDSPASPTGKRRAEGVSEGEGSEKRTSKVVRVAEAPPHQDKNGDEKESAEEETINPEDDWDQSSEDSDDEPEVAPPLHADGEEAPARY